MTNTAHWTEKSTKDFLFAIALDFVDQLEAKMKALGWSRAKLAKKAKVDKSYVSQVLNNPGNLSLDTIVKFARVLKLKVSVVAYDDGDKSNENGPINAEIFRLCWEHAKKPADMWTLRENTKATTKETVYVFTNTGIGGWHSGKPNSRITPQLPGKGIDQQSYQNARFAVSSLITKEASLSELLNEVKMPT